LADRFRDSRATSTRAITHFNFLHEFVIDAFLGTHFPRRINHVATRTSRPTHATDRGATFDPLSEPLGEICRIPVLVYIFARRPVSPASSSTASDDGNQPTRAHSMHPWDATANPNPNPNPNPNAKRIINHPSTSAVGRHRRRRRRRRQKCKRNFAVI
jgi:hypothetical protein